MSLLGEYQPWWCHQFMKTPPSLDIYSPCLPILLTISRIYDTPCSPLLPLPSTIHDIFNTLDSCVALSAFDINQSICDHYCEPKMQLAIIWLPNSIVAVTNTIQMPTQEVQIWGSNDSDGVSKWVAEAMGIWQKKGGWTTQSKYYKVRESNWGIPQSISIRNKLGAGSKKWDLILHHCVTQISNQVLKRVLWKCCMAA